jgi:DNA-binding NarL/FixJ family response regulator
MRRRNAGATVEGVPLRCLLIDDNASFLQAATALFRREGLTVVGVASNAAEAVRQAQELRPDVVVVDIMLGPESGFELAQRLVDANPDGPKVILTSTYSESDFADLINNAPVAGFVAKSELSASVIRRLAGAG